MKKMVVILILSLALMLTGTCYAQDNSKGTLGFYKCLTKPPMFMHVDERTTNSLHVVYGEGENLNNAHESDMEVNDSGIYYGVLYKVEGSGRPHTRMLLAGKAKLEWKQQNTLLFEVNTYIEKNIYEFHKMWEPNKQK
ncbi:MAG: hypothetical protein KQI78_14490 [Deltaproteobacteria bacterium]|nr:hypothetical protein [Deltaproteobacteria bacterium]